MRKARHLVGPKRLLAATGIMLTAFGIAPLAASPAAAKAAAPAYVPAEGPFYRIKNDYSHLCVSVTGTATKTKAREETCSSAHTEQWFVKKEIVVDGLDYVWLANRSSGLCLGQNGKLDVTGNLCVTTRTRETQQWRGLDSTTDGYRQWTSRQAGKCMGLQGGSKKANTVVVLASCADHTQQLWKFIAP
jgi:hypothetical protein